MPGMVFIQQMVDADIPLYLFTGHWDTNKPNPNVPFEEIAAHYLKQMQTIQPHGPYILGGFCAGGLVAFEMAQQLHRQGERVDLLFLLDSAPPGNRRARGYARMLNRAKYHWNILSRLSRHEQAAYLLEKAQRKIRTKINLVIGKLFRILRHRVPSTSQRPLSVRVYRQARQGYQAQPYAGEIILWHREYRSDKYIPGWQRIAEGGLEHHSIFVKDHLELIKKEEYARIWIEHLDTCLVEAQAQAIE
jgi:thioesterase domain-containing protein